MVVNTKNVIDKEFLKMEKIDSIIPENLTI